MIDQTLCTLVVEEGKVSSLAIVWDPGTEMVPELQEGEVAVFVTLFNRSTTPVRRGVGVADAQLHRATRCL